MSSKTQATAERAPGDKEGASCSFCEWSGGGEGKVLNTTIGDIQTVRSFIGEGSIDLNPDDVARLSLQRINFTSTLCESQTSVFGGRKTTRVSWDELHSKGQCESPQKITKIAAQVKA